MKTWQLQEARKNLSEVIKRALKDGPQRIVKDDEKSVVVVSYNEYLQMKKRQTSLSEFFRVSPLAKMNIKLKRDNSFEREAGKWLGM